MTGETPGAGIAVLQTGVRFDSNNTADTEQGLRHALHSGARKVVCDLAATDYVSSAALRVLLATAKELQNGGGELVLCAPRPCVLEVLETAGFTRLLKVFDSRADAVAHVTTPD